MSFRPVCLLVVLFAVVFSDIAIDTTTDARDNAADDYGHIVSHYPLGVVAPQTVEELSDIVVFANAAKVPVAAVGQAHSVKGQAQVEDGIVVNMTNINSIQVFPNDNFAWVGAGATWRELLQATLTVGLTPPVFTDYIDLSIGGTISVGGVGSQTYREGLQIDNVLALKVITSDGVVQLCSASANSDLFHAVLGGLGQFGIVVEAQIPIVPALANTLYVRTLYVDIDDFLADLFVLTSDERYDGVQGFVVPNDAAGLAGATGNAFPDLQVPIGNFPWLYMIEGSKYYANGNVPDVPTLVGDLNHIPQDALNVLELTYFQFIARLDPVEAFLRSIGVWYLPHPWIDVFVPRDESSSYILNELSLITAEDVNGVILVYPYLNTPIQALNFPTPDGEEFVLFALLRTAIPPERALELSADNDEVYDRARAVGGTGYSIDAIPLEPKEWKKHFGNQRYKDLKDAKQLYDPNQIFAPSQFVFKDKSNCNNQDDDE